MLEAIARLLGGVPSVYVTLKLQVDASRSSDEQTVYRGLVVIGCDHAAAKDAYAVKMKAKRLGPIPLSGSAQEIENDIVNGTVLGRIQERLALAKEAHEEDMAAKEKAATAKAEKPAAKTTAKAAPAAKVAKTPEELKEIGKKATAAAAQTSLLDETVEEEEAPAPAPAPAAAKMAAPQVGPKPNKDVKKFIDLIDELEFAVGGKDKKIALQKLEEIKAVGGALIKLGTFKKDSENFSVEARAAYDRFNPKDETKLSAQALALPDEPETITEEVAEEDDVEFEQ